jgi:hypothetical protein
VAQEEKKEKEEVMNWLDRAKEFLTGQTTQELCYPAGTPIQEIYEDFLAEMPEGQEPARLEIFDDDRNRILDFRWKR